MHHARSAWPVLAVLLGGLVVLLVRVPKRGPQVAGRRLEPEPAELIQDLLRRTLVAHVHRRALEPGLRDLGENLILSEL